MAFLHSIDEGGPDSLPLFLARIMQSLVGRLICAAS